METTKKKGIFYGWVIIGCLFLIAAVPMVFQSNFFAYYQVPVSQDLGCDYVMFSTTNIFNTIAGMFFGIFLAGKVCSGNIRVAMLIGGIGAGLACVASSFVTQIWQFWILGFVLNVCMSCFTYTPINFLINRWFVDKRGLVTSIVFAGSGVGGAIFSKPFATILAEHGWRYCYRFTGVLCVVVIAIAALLIRKDPSEKGLTALGAEKAQQSNTDSSEKQQLVGVTKAEALKTPSFYLYALSLVFVGMTAAGIMTHVPTFLVEENLDYALIMAVFSFVFIFAQLIMGVLYDKIGVVKGVLINVLVSVAGLVFLTAIGVMGSAAAYIAMVLIALGGTVSSIYPPLITGKCFGNKDFGGIYGIGNTFFMAGCMIGPMVSAAVREASGSYIMAWIIYMVVFVGIFVFGLLAIKKSPLNAKK